MSLAPTCPPDSRPRLFRLRPGEGALVAGWGRRSECPHPVVLAPQPATSATRVALVAGRRVAPPTAGRDCSGCAMTAGNECNSGRALRCANSPGSRARLFPRGAGSPSPQRFRLPSSMCMSACPRHPSRPRPVCLPLPMCVSVCPGRPGAFARRIRLGRPSCTHLPQPRSPNAVHRRGGRGNWAGCPAVDGPAAVRSTAGRARFKSRPPVDGSVAVRSTAGRARFRSRPAVDGSVAVRSTAGRARFRSRPAVDGSVAVRSTAGRARFKSRPPRRRLSGRAVDGIPGPGGRPMCLPGTLPLCWTCGRQSVPYEQRQRGRMGSKDTRSVGGGGGDVGRVLPHNFLDESWSRP